MSNIVIDNKKLKSLVSNICRDIMLTGYKPDYIVGLTRGGLVPATMISHYLDVPMHALKISLRDHEFTESNCWMAEDAFGYEYSDAPASDNSKKNILIVDDINDSGNTFNYLMDDWKTICLPNDDRWNDIWNNNVRFGVLVDNCSSRCNVKMDYVGMDNDTPDQWIEFPWEKWWAK